MLDIIRNTAEEPIELGDYTEYLRENVDFSDQASIRESAPMLGRLYLNRHFLRDHVLSGLAGGPGKFEAENRYTPPSIILGMSEKFLLRANLWRTGESEGIPDINLYRFGHDHNFDFLTQSYFGPCYTSRMYSYDRGSIAGRPGEKVAMIDEGLLALKEGEMYLYRKNVDIHEQFPPLSTSVTINVMSRVNFASDSQYVFDLGRGTITSVIGGFFARKHVYEMALLLDDPECNEVMRHTLERTNCALTRELLSGLKRDSQRA